MLGAACRLKSTDKDEEAKAFDRMCTIVFGLELFDGVVPVSKIGGFTCVSVFVHYMAKSIRTPKFKCCFEDIYIHNLD